MIYRNSKSLETIRAVSREVETGLSDRSMTIATSAIKPVLVAHAAGVSVAALGRLAAVAGGAALAPVLPVVLAMTTILSVGAKRKLRQEKERLLQEIVRKQAAVIKEMEKELDASVERNEYLQCLNELLQQGIRNLQSDLAEARQHVG